MRQFLISLGCTFFMTGLFGADPKYPVSQIPANLMENVDAVVREDKMVFTIHADNKATLQIRFVVTILNSRANHYALVSGWYSKLRKITRFQCNVLDKDGLILKKLKSNEVIDESAYDGITMHSDTRIKKADLTQDTYPYTIEFDSEIEYNFLYYIDGSYINAAERVSVQNASYELVFPKQLTPRYKTDNIKQQPVRKNVADGVESLSWAFENLTPPRFEPLSDHDDLIQKIKAAPSKFEFEGYAGSMNTWDEYGRWILSLNKGRDQLPPETKQKIKLLTSQANSNEERIRILYEYLQSKTRYVGVQLGIGGYQPFDALVVDQTGYGDCKALSNYMVAMLKEIGIHAHYVLIYAGDDHTRLDESFPSSQFNHATVAVPNERDTVWLECTSQSNPFDYQGSFTGDRKALFITDNGAKIVNTHYYPAEDNTQTRSADVFLDVAGNAKAKVSTTYAGLQYEKDNLNFFLDNIDQQRKWLQRNIDIPVFDINGFVIKDNKTRIPSAEVKVDLALKNLATASAKRLFLTPNLMNRSTFIPEKMEYRTMNVVLQETYIHTDTIRYHIPESIYPEYLPTPVQIKSEFGEYEMTCIADQGSIVFIRRLKQNKGIFPPDSYNRLIDFYKSIKKADNTKIVFLNKT